MEKKRYVLELRERLDKTLALPDLSNAESIKSLVKNQLLHSSLSGIEGNIDLITEKRTEEVSNFLDMLRSASGNEKDALNSPGNLHGDWKVKQDTDDLRVMYRRGPHGTPFHTLLTEGYADGPIDVCLCVSWESTLYRKWFPQFNVPTFKIIMSNCLKKVGIGEEISLVRVKVPWPISDREALLHFFEIEYLKEDLILVLINTILDEEQIDVNSHGFSRDGIPDAGDVVRIELVGGFAMQKVNDKRSYFRAIANLDIKLDFVPPSLINFISRQLIGTGHKLYQKAVSSVAIKDKDYQQALRQPMYVRIRECLLSNHCKLQTPVSSPVEKSTPLTNHDGASGPEIVEEGIEQSGQHVVQDQAIVSLEVKHALEILDNVIGIVRRNRLSSSDTDCPRISQKSTAYGINSEAGAIGVRDLFMAGYNLPNGYAADITTKDARTGNASGATAQSAAMENTRKVFDEESLEAANGFGKPKHSRKKNRWLCCSTLGMEEGEM